MKTDFNFTNTNRQTDIRKELEGRSIYEMTVWTRDHAQHLKWFCSYDEEKIDAIIQPLMSISHHIRENYQDDLEAKEFFKNLCVLCVLQLEITCRQ